MHNFASTSPGSARITGLDLFRLWDVDEDSRYDILRTWEMWAVTSWGREPSADATPMVAARTVSGAGLLDTHDGARFDLVPGTVLVLPWASIKRWRTHGDRWDFFWFEFFADQVEPFQPYAPLHQPLRDAELNEITAITRLLRQEHEADRCYATARFAALLYGWVLRHDADPGRDTPHRARIERAIDLMHDRIADNLPIAEIARAVDLSPRTFASVFERATGQTPKRYYVALRLENARALLTSGRFNVQQTADRLGFSSPFHLSKAYKQHFGHPPSQAG